jgi:hypothetical protein
MSLIPRYLVNNRTSLVANVTGFITEYRPVYQRNISVYSGIDNKLEFQLLNPDQKPINPTGSTIHFVAFDENKNQIIKHTGTVLIANKGLFKITIAENDLLNIKQQYLSYSIYLTDNTTNNNTLTFADEQLNAVGTIYVSGSALPGPRDTVEVTNFTQDSGDVTIYNSDHISAEPAINGNEALHTAVIYTNNYIGDVTIQVTLENQVDYTTEWSDLDIVTFVGSETEPHSVNFTGVFNYVRFKTTANPSEKITKILVRN